MMFRGILILGGIALGMGGGGLDAKSAWDLSGSVGGEARWFAQDPLWEDRAPGWDRSGVLDLEVYRESSDGRWALLVAGFARWDERDAARTHADLREAYGQWRGEAWELKAGVGKVFWGVTESRHLVDFVNQTDLVENPDGEDKLGQPMLQLTRLWGRGTLDLLLLPVFRERTFPGRDGRLRPPTPVSAEARFEDRTAWSRPDTVLRWKTYLGDVDLGLSAFHGTSRDPNLTLAVAEGADGGLLRAFYPVIDQLGLDLQYTVGAWLWKIEALARSGVGQHYRALAGGFEYTVYGVGGGSWDLGLLAEGHFDSRGSRSPDPFNRDVFAGARLALNDEWDTSVLIGGVVDVATGSRSGRLEIQRRLTSRLTLNLEAQWFGRIAPRDPLHTARRDSYLQIELRTYF